MGSEPTAVTQKSVSPYVLTVPSHYAGPGRAKSQILGGMAVRSCVGLVGVVVAPKLPTGHTTVKVQVRGTGRRVRGASFAWVLTYNNTFDPALAAARIKKVRSGRYELAAQFRGDKLRLPSTLREGINIGGNC